MLQPGGMFYLLSKFISLKDFSYGSRTYELSHLNSYIVGGLVGSLVVAGGSFTGVGLLSNFIFSIFSYSMGLAVHTFRVGWFERAGVDLNRCFFS